METIMAGQLYENTGIKQKVIDEIRAFAKTYDVELVKLFGSRSKYDIVDMGASLQPELRESIEREGKILYEKI